MDVIEFFQDVVTAWNAENKCDECWTFGAPLTEDALNKQQTPDGVDPCCVHVFISDLVISSVRAFATTGYQSARYDNHSFNLYVLKKGDLGTNNYNEIAGHPISESRWQQTLKPLKECLDDQNLLPFCTELDNTIQITNWQMSTKIAYLDGNYVGWLIRATFKELIQ